MNSSVNKSPLETGRAVELTTGEQMDIIVWSSSPTFPTVCKILENKVLQARDEAMLVDPKDREAQVSCLTQAHAMAKFYQWFRDEVERASANELAKLKEKANRALVQDRDVIESIIVGSAAGN